MGQHGFIRDTNPPRTAVSPLPETSQANPNRGEMFLSVGLLRKGLLTKLQSVSFTGSARYAELPIITFIGVRCVSLELVPQPQVQGEPGVHPPIILDIEGS